MKTGTPEEFIAALEDRIAELENEQAYASTNTSNIGMRPVANETDIMDDEEYYDDSVMSNILVWR